MADSVVLNALLGEYLLWGLARDVVEVTEEAPDTTQSLVKAVRHNVPISKKGYLALARVLAKRVQKAQLESATTTPQLSEKDWRITEL